ncbi:MAG: hypothetical protein D6696_15930 [Acidobacteria bacterium]|nr:MAG: hypothetical protein D6696_15930 [Acidobacteriota bacterium]
MIRPRENVPLAFPYCDRGKGKSPLGRPTCNGGKGNRHRRRIFLLLLPLLVAGAAVAQPEPATPVDEETWTPRPGVYVGTAGCTNALCHGAAAPRGEDGDDVRNDEYTVWLSDPHRLNAFRILESPLSQAIAEALEPGSRATELALCRDCHALAAAAGSALVEAEGISCEGCHGPAGGWVDRHYERRSDWSRARSIENGMIDLRDPTNRARLCGGCHLGDARRAVDHRLIAAGHPQLQFELDNFSLSERWPRHFFLDRERATPRGESHGLRAWAVGQLVAWRDGLDFLAARAGGGGPWPELSSLSCRSCHHPLAGGSWRRQPGYRFRGGLPPWSPARWVVLRALLGELAPDRLATLEADVERLGEALSTFADRSEVARLAAGLSRTSADLAPVVDRAEWSVERARRLVRALAADPALAAADVATAEQVAFGLRSLVAYLVEHQPAQQSGTLASRVAELFDALADPDAFDRQRFVDVLAALAANGP